MDGLHPGDGEADWFCEAEQQNHDEASALTIERWGVGVCRRREVRVVSQGSKEQPAAETDRTGVPCLACTR